MFNSLLASSLEKHVLSQVLKNCNVENLETTPSTFLSRFSSEVYVSRIINYWGSIFTLYLTWGAFSLAYVLSIFFFYRYFRWQTLKRKGNESREGSGNHYFFCFLLPPAHENSFSLSRYLPFPFNWSICYYQTDSWWDLFS